jgi:hypothetical protein
VPPTPDPADPRNPVPPALRAAAGLVLVEGLLTVGFGITEAANSSIHRLVLGVTTVVFFVLYGVGLMWCAWGMNHLRSWARGPVLLSQLLLLGLAWSVHRVALPLSIGSAVVAGLVLAGMLHPASIDALNREE